MAGRPKRRARQAQEDYERGLISKDEARREGVVFDDDEPESPMGDTVPDLRPARTILEEVEAELAGTPFPDTVLPFEYIDHPKKRAFLIAYSECGSTRKAERLSGVAKRYLYTPTWQNDEVFQEALAVAKAMAADALEDELVRRAVDGVDEPVGWYKGVAGGTVKKYSDPLLLAAVKARKREYREQIDVRAALANFDMNKLDDEQLQRIASGESILSVLGGALRQHLLPAGAQVGVQDD